MAQSTTMACLRRHLSWAAILVFRWLRGTVLSKAGGPMRSQTIVSPENQNVTFVELFFDLVFVFSVTQVVSLLHETTWANWGSNRHTSTKRSS